MDYCNHRARAHTQIEEIIELKENVYYNITKGSLQNNKNGTETHTT